MDRVQGKRPHSAVPSPTSRLYATQNGEKNSPAADRKFLRFRRRRAKRSRIPPTLYRNGIPIQRTSFFGASLGRITNGTLWRRQAPVTNQSKALQRREGLTQRICRMQMTMSNDDLQMTNYYERGITEYWG